MIQTINKAALYARYSSDNQRSESIDAQLRAMQNYCQQNHILIVETYIDEAKSATTDHRPSFQKMIADSKYHQFNIILVHKLDCFARNRYDSAVYKRELKKNGVSVYSVLEDLDDSPESIMMESMLEGMSEYYSQNLAREVMKGMRETALQCKHTGGKPPLGYDLNTDGKLIINQGEAEVVQQIFKMYLDNYSYSKMAEVLNKKGYRTKTGSLFRKNSFYSILRQEKYTGVYIWNQASAKQNGMRNNHKSKALKDQVRIQGGCPSIISRSDFEEVQKKMQERAHGKAESKARRYYMLGGKGFLQCGICGKSMTGTVRKSHGKTYITYQCPSHKAKQCETKEVRADRLNLIVAQQLAEFFFREDRLKDWEDLLRSDIRNDPENKSLKNRIKGIDKKMENILQNLEDVVSKALTKRLEELTQKKEELENKLKKFTNVPTKLTTNDIRKYKTRFIQLLMNEDIPEARQFLKDTIKKITVYNNKITVTFNLKTMNQK